MHRQAVSCLAMIAVALALSACDGLPTEPGISISTKNVVFTKAGKMNIIVTDGGTVARSITSVGLSSEVVFNMKTPKASCKVTIEPGEGCVYEIELKTFKEKSLAFFTLKTLTESVSAEIATSP